MEDFLLTQEPEMSVSSAVILVTTFRSSSSASTESFDEDEKEIKPKTVSPVAKGLVAKRKGTEQESHPMEEPKGFWKHFLAVNMTDMAEMKEGRKYCVIINFEGDTVGIRHPKLTRLPRPELGIGEHHVFLKCEQPTRSLSDRTIIPMKGMYGFLFHEKAYIRHDHALLNGKIHAWRVECMNAFQSLREEGRFRDSAMSLQEAFVQDKASQVQDRIEAFDHCHIRLLNKDAIEEIVLQYECTHSTELVYNMCKCDCFQIIIVPTHTRHRMDLITRFN